MKITEVKTAEVRGHGYSLFVKVYTDEGLTGVGECIHGGAGVARLVAEMAESIVGKDPLNVDRLFETMRRVHVFNGAMAGNVVTAMTGIEIALWDLAGKALNVPVYQLLGGKFRDSIRLYCDCHAGRDDSPESHAQRAREVIAMGFDAIKFDIDDASSPHKQDPYNWSVSPGELAEMVDKVAAVREAVGPRVDLAIDMHGRYDTYGAIRVAQALEPYDLMWLEEPVPPENVDAMREVKRATRTPICAGENLYLRWGFRDLIEKQAVDVIMPDIPKCCGLSEGRKIATMAEVYYIPLAPHNVCGPLGTIASCHVCATVPNFLVLEWHWVDRPAWHELVCADPPLIQNGHIRLPDGPGLGVELNEDAAREYARPGSAFFE
ncbi:MAG: mandelate racemase/muconate lactonizing enzyme family protein [Candidatus Latescibacteria bacterium]|nr:mandelate racemase/muconate lactonizing enzyme family protein [Candidatus Latescibacterota bacterium]